MTVHRSFFHIKLIAHLLFSDYYMEECMLQRVRKGIMFYAPINVNPAMGGGGGGAGQGWGWGTLIKSPEKTKQT